MLVSLVGRVDVFSVLVELILCVGGVLFISVSW